LKPSVARVEGSQAGRPGVDKAKVREVLRKCQRTDDKLLRTDVVRAAGPSSADSRTLRNVA
jgi:hypothetical protein